MANRGRKGSLEPNAPPAGVEAAGSLEAKVEEFAEDLGRVLGTARAKAEGWIDQRKTITTELAKIRDTASELLTQLAGRGADMAPTVRRGPGRPRKDAIRAGEVYAPAPPTKRQRRKMSAAGRARISKAQKLRWAKQKAGK